MFTHNVAAIVLLAGAASAKFCVNMTIPVTISSRNGVFGNLETPQTNMDATAFALAGTKQGFNGTAASLTGYATVSGTYNISGKLCSPTAPSASSNTTSVPTLQILTHGIGFDKTYWDFAYNSYNYSYVNNALASGYHTFLYDRLGIGNSSHGEPKNEIQSFLEIAALADITNKFRAGSIPGVAKKYTKIVHVGHSFGSAQSFALTAMYPNISDGIVLTGFSMNSSFVPLFNAGAAFEQAFLNQPLRFGSKLGVMALSAFTQTYQSLADLLAPIDLTTLQPLDYPPGYLVNANAGTTNFLFLLNGFFDPKLLPVAEAGKQPVTVGEGLTLGSVPMMNTFAGPVLVLTGSNDVPYCGGDCSNTGDPTVPNLLVSVKKALPNARTFTATVQPNMGHGINFHYNQTGAYSYIQSWLGSNGLAA